MKQSESGFWRKYLASILFTPVIILLAPYVIGSEYHTIYFILSIYTGFVGPVILVALCVWSIVGFVSIPFVAISRRRAREGHRNFSGRDRIPPRDE
jgi:hypothetical protein